MKGIINKEACLLLYIFAAATNRQRIGENEMRGIYTDVFMIRASIFSLHSY